MSTQPPFPPFPPPEPDKDAIINRLFKEATRDSLTGLYNARYFHELLSVEVARALRYKVPFSLLRAHLGNFRQLNEIFCPLSKNKVLKAVSEPLGQSTRATDFACRIGEADFAVILTHTEQTSASCLCGRLKQRIIKKLQLPEASGPSAVSLNFAVTEYQPPESSDSLIKRADRALYRGKNDDDDLDDGLLGVPVRV